MLLVKVCNSFITFSDNIGDQLRASTKKKVLSLFHPINLNLPKIKNKKSAKKDLGLTNSNYVSFIGLIIASFYGYFLFNESPDIYTWLGAIVIFIGIIIITIRELKLDKELVRAKVNINS